MLDVCVGPPYIFEKFNKFRQILLKTTETGITNAPDKVFESKWSRNYFLKLCNNIGIVFNFLTSTPPEIIRKP